MSDLKTFHGTLYKSRSRKTESECLSHLDSIYIPKLSEDEKNLCEGKLMVKECWDALNSVGENKSPEMMVYRKNFIFVSLKKFTCILYKH